MLGDCATGEALDATGEHVRAHQVTPDEIGLCAQSYIQSHP